MLRLVGTSGFASDQGHVGEVAHENAQRH
jgi:hypothetical protein